MGTYSRASTCSPEKKDVKTLNELFASAVARFPERPALMEPAEASGGGEAHVTTLTYAMLQQRVQQVAGALQQQGIEKGDRVLIWSVSRSNWMIAYLATLLVGAVVVPLDLHLQTETLHRIIRITEATRLITTPKQYQQLKGPLPPLIDITHLPEHTLDSSRLPPVCGDDLAEVAFTSGTTGHPKGVMLSHGNITSNAQAALRVVEVQLEDRALSILPLSHLFEATIEVALLAQGASVLYARSLSPGTLLRLLGTQGITCMVLVPQVLELFMRHLEREVRRQGKARAFKLLQHIAPALPFSLRRLLFRRVHQRLGSRFRFFISGGASLVPELARWWETMGFRVLQGYGATECAPIVTATSVRERRYGTVGKPLPGQQVRIAKDGEILVHGPNVALGYWKDPEATRAAFRDGWYATDDLGSLDAQGNLFLRGRKTDLIVLPNGLNVSPEEVEQVLVASPAIKDAAVVGIPRSKQDLVLHAVLLMDDPTQARAAIQRANQRLAPYQQVRGFTVWPEADFPRTPTTQKIKRSELLERLCIMQNQGQSDGSLVTLS